MVPTVAKYIYLRETSPLGVAAISMVEVGQQSTISINGTQAASASKASVSRGSTSSALLASGGLTAAAFIAEAATVVVPSDAVEINGNGSIYVESNKSYVIKSGVTFTGTINANNGSSNVKIYVQGAWKNTGNEFNLGGNNTLIVSQSGSIQLANVTQNTNGRFENYGAASLSKMTTTNSSLYINYGTLDVNEATVTNGSFTNYGIATIQKLSSSTSGTIVRNEGTLTVDNADFTNATLEAVCHTTIKTMKTNGATISIASGSLLSLEDLNATGTKINLAASSILDVTTKVTFDTWSNNLMGPSSGQALARLKKVAIMGFGSIIADTPDPELRKEYGELLNANSNQLLRLITDVLEMSQMDAGKVRLKNSDVSLKGILNELSLSYLPNDEQPAIIFDIPERELVAWLDRGRVIQVLVNLINNSLKFTPPDGVIHVGYSLKEDHIEFYVKDNGIGIAKEKQDSIFKRFYKINPLDKGTGLGLAICKGIMEQMNGEITVESELGQGTTFIIILPIGKQV